MGETSIENISLYTTKIPSQKEVKHLLIYDIFGQLNSFSLRNNPVLASVSKTARSRSTCKTKSSVHFICTLSNIYLPSSFRNWICSRHYLLQGVKACFSLNIYLLINKSPDKCCTSLSTCTLPCLMPDVVNRTFGNRTQSNSNRSNDFDWVW